MSDISAVNCSERMAVAEDGRLGEITNLFDAEGEDTDDAALAVVAVVKLADDEWCTVDLTAFQPARLN